MSVVGGWRNTYGSILDIRSCGPGGALSGRYSSETGATGTYGMTGWSPPSPDGDDNRSLCACIAWKPDDSDEPDPSWHWVSIMAGVVLRDSPDLAPRLQLLHGLVASTPMPAVAIAQPGVYVETLTFEPLADPSAPQTPVRVAGDHAARREPARLILTNRDPASRFQSLRLVLETSGRAAASLHLTDQVAEAAGFADAAPASTLRSLALATTLAGGLSVALGGFIDTERQTAVLEMFEARAVSYANKYTAVRASQETFVVSIAP